MLPLGNRPTVDYLVQDCIRAGITDIYFVVSGPASQLRHYYSRDVELESYLRSKNKNDLIAEIKPPVGVRFHYIEQDLHDGRYGTALPIWLCRDVVEPDERIVVVMGDAILYVLDGPSDIERMVAHGRPAALGIRVEEGVDLSQSGGVISLNEAGGYRAIVEHADPSIEPSRIKNCGMYVLPGTIMKYIDDYIRAAQPAYNGEYFLIDPINTLARSESIDVLESVGEFLDSGSVESWIIANTWLQDHNVV